MPVPSAITDLSQTAGSNFPTGSESPITTDNYLRQYAAFIAELRDNDVLHQDEGASGDVWLWTRTLTGVKAIGAGPLLGYSPSSYMFDIYSDNADAGADFLVGFRVRHQFGGAAMEGGGNVARYV